MTTFVDEARSRLLEGAVEAVDRPEVPTEQLRSFVHRYFRHVPDEDLERRDPVDIAGCCLSHWQFAAHREDGTAKVRTFTPTVDEQGWSTGHTVVEIVTDDMPFLVDSVSAELTRQDRAIHLVIHPTFVVRRTVTGELLEVLDLSASTVPSGRRDPSWPDDARVESWMHVEIDRESDPEALDRLTGSLHRVLQDVRAAVEDWPKMRATAGEIAEELRTAPPAGLEREASEARRLLQWLSDDNFTFLGYREYRLDEVDGDDVLTAVGGSGLGILRYDQRRSSDSFSRLPAPARARARERHVLVLTKANSRATVHRGTYLDYVGIKSFDDQGDVVGERRFLGLFTSAAYLESVRRLPVIDAKVDAVLERAGFAPDSHSGKDVLAILETYPRDELFQISLDQLYDTVMAVLQLQERRRTRLFLRRDEYGRFISAMVFLPRDRYTTQVRLRMEQVLRDAFGAATVDYTTRVSESVLARLHYVLRIEPGRELPDVDESLLERTLVEATRTWEEDLVDALRSEVGEEEAARLMRTWSGSFPEAYKEDFAARMAVGDLRRLEQLSRIAETGSGEGDESVSAGRMATNLYEPVGAAPEERRFKLFRAAPLSLTTVLPFFRNLGVEVVDERPYELERNDGRCAYVYDFGLRFPTHGDFEDARELFMEAFAAAWAGQAESDGLDALVLQAGLTWRQVVALRAYTKYLRQTGSTFSLDYVQRCLSLYVDITRALVCLFETRFDPDMFGDDETGTGERSDAVHALVEEVGTALEDVASLDHDRILRWFLATIMATARTNFYQVDENGQPKAYVSFKLEPGAIPDLPEPRPAHEVWVYAPHVEGVHLRFGAVARGGLRWSDRSEDFRTEVLGLVKAQMVKNAVIVPTGAKGGFVGKALPDPTEDREAWLEEGVRCYTTFIRGLLDVTDNLAPDTSGGARQVVPPERVVRHDADDTYLVVAADKGTATFSDIANSVSEAYGFWLGDAFASGGSVGYDHKAMGITARGAWESVKRHFREMGVDTQSEDFTVVGVGDMSGDVFGNGMLLSEHIRLVAAFDHRHIFLDPDPDPAASFAERRRLFEMGRSSWADYDRSLISEGGGVHPRSAKSIAISPQVAASLGLPDGVRRMAPNELLRAVLAAPVDLLWNGGIGTYVKASRESHTDVGDKANDSIRIDGGQVRAKVIGEGGNLGLTQRGRIEAALNGVRVNTDAIDNSAGVDCSDHEVNIKILLNGITAAGDLTGKQRNQLLADMTDEVGRLVLRDNYEHNVLLGNARRQAHGMLPVHQRFIRALEADGRLDRGLEQLPSDAEIAERLEAGQGLTSPEFSILLAYSKITIAESVLATDLPDEPWFQQVLRDYFPAPLVERYDDRLASHPLRREIVTTCLVNEIVNRGGITFVYRAMEESGTDVEHVMRAYAVCREIFGLREFVESVEALDGQVPTDVQTTLYLEFRRLLDRSTRWFLHNLRDDFDVETETQRFGATVTRWRGRIGELLVGSELDRFRRHGERMIKQGVPEELAWRYAGLLDEFPLLDIVEGAGQEDVDPDTVAAVYYLLSDRYGANVMLRRIAALERQNRWEALARGALRDDLYAALDGLTRAVLSQTDAGDPLERIEAWERGNAGQLARVRQTIEDVQRLEKSDLASLSVALRLLRGVIRSGYS